MKNLYLIGFLFITTFSLAQIVNIPDANFKDALVNTLCVDIDGDNVLDNDVDTNDDGEIQVSEAEAVTNLSIYYREINSLVGIESFTNIIQLSCGQNNLTNLDLSQNLNLEVLFCRWNNLTSIDVTQNSNLLVLWCSANQLASLDVSQNPNLESFSCSSNSLTSLDVSQNPNLQSLRCDENGLTNLDVFQSPNLLLLDCSFNQLPSLDVSQNSDLIYLYCGYNPQLTYLNVNNNNNNLNMESLCTLICENLFCIDVDDPVYANEQNDIPSGCAIFAEGWSKDDWTIYSEDCVLGLEDYNSIVFTMTPNPTQNVLNIRSKDAIESIKIYSLQGKLIKEGSSTAIDVTALSNGLYFAQVSIGGKTTTKKFVRF